MTSKFMWILFVQAYGNGDRHIISAYVLYPKRLFVFEPEALIRMRVFRVIPFYIKLGYNNWRKNAFHNRVPYGMKFALSKALQT